MSANPPLWSPRFRTVENIDGTLKIEYKPYPSYYTWLTMIDNLASYAAVVAALSVLQGMFESGLSDLDTRVTALESAAPVTVSYPNTYTINPQATHTISGGFGVFVRDTNQVNNGTYPMVGLNTEVSFSVPLAAGDYVLKLMLIKYSAGGDHTLYVDGNLISTLSSYAAAPVYNWENGHVINGLSEGLHTFNIKQQGKQPASTGYNLAVSYITVSPNP